MPALYGESSAGRVAGSDRLLIQTVAPVSAFALLCGGQRHLFEPQDSRSAGVGFDWTGLGVIIDFTVDAIVVPN